MKLRCLLGWHHPWYPMDGFYLVEGGEGTCQYCGAWFKWVIVCGLMVWSRPVPWKER